LLQGELDMPKKAKAAVAANTATKSATKRTGAGRPKGSGKFGCATKVIRIPTHLQEEIVNFITKKIKAEKK
jgi:hypothetical protein